MQFNEFTHETHFFIHRQFQLIKNLWNHTATHHLMAVKGPPMACFKFFCNRLPDIVQNGGPSQPEIVGMSRNIVEHLQGMVEIIFMTQSVDIFSTRQVSHFWKNDL